jgi:Arc/MetJ family transcription regulator
VRRTRDEEPELVLVLSTLGAPERRGLRRRKGAKVDSAAPEAVPTNRATVVRTEPFPTLGHAESWLAAVRDDERRRDDELDRSLATINGALHAYRVAQANPHTRDVGLEQTLVARIGYGSGDEAVAGMFKEAWELPRGGRRVKRSMEAPEERFAALLGGRETVLACEELVLRARMDLTAGRGREAALQARVALEALLAELPELSGDRRGALETDRGAVGDAANAALRGDLTEDLADGLHSSVERMEAALKARRLGTSA